MPDIIHLHCNFLFNKTNVLLLLVPAIVYVFIIGFYLISAGFSMEVNQATTNSPFMATDHEDSNILGESNIDK